MKFNSLDIKKAEKVFLKMQAACEQADVVPDGLTFNSLDVKIAEEIFEQIKSASMLPNLVKFSSLDVQKAE